MEYLNKALSMLDENAHASATLGLFLVLYAGLAAPKLPKHIALLFDNSVFKLTIMFLIAYMSSRNSSVAIVATVALVVSLQTLSMYQTNDIILDAVKNKEVVRVTTEEPSSDEQLSEGVSDEQLSEGVSEEQYSEGVSEEQYSEGVSEEQYSEGVSEEQLSEGVSEEQLSEGVSEEQLFIQESVEDPREKTNKLNNVVGWGDVTYSSF